MYMPRFRQLTGLILLNTILVACGGGDGSHLDNIIDDSNGGGGGGGGVSGSYLDCSALDPKKVYLRGATGPEVIVNLDNPREYCTGIETDSGTKLTISNSGKLVYSIDGDSEILVYEFNQDEYGEIRVEGDEFELDYPQNVLDNDTLLLRLPSSPWDLFSRQDGSASNQLFFQMLTDVYSSDSVDAPYFENIHSWTLLGVMPDGSLLMKEEGSLYLVDTAFNEFALTSPDEGVYYFEETSRVFTDPNTGNQCAWIIAIDAASKSDRRWKVDLVTKTITDEGAFIGAPDYVDLLSLSFNSSDEPILGSFRKLDGDGNLIQRAEYSSTPPGSDKDITNPNYKNLIIKRPIESGGQPFEILMSDTDYDGTFQWRQEEWPYAHVSGSVLVTGQ